MLPPAALPRRRLLLRGAVATLATVAPDILLLGASGSARAQPADGNSGSGSNTLAPWRPSEPPQLDAVDLLTGQRRTLADFAGHPLLVNFWASWCAPCRVEMPSLNALAERLAPRGWAFIAVNHGEMPARVQRFLNEVPIRSTVLLDRSQTVFKAWGGRALPGSFVFDGRGRPRAWAQGERDWMAPALVSALEAMG